MQRHCVDFLIVRHGLQIRSSTAAIGLEVAHGGRVPQEPTISIGGKIVGH
jgi:hypothetical protein